MNKKKKYVKKNCKSPKKSVLYHVPTAGDLIAASQSLKGAYKRAGEELFTRVCRARTRGDNFKLKEDRFRRAIRKKNSSL